MVDGARNDGSARYRQNLEGMPSTAAIDFGGLSEGALVGTSLDAQGLRRQLCRGLTPVQADDVEVSEITAATLQDQHMGLTDNVQHFLGRGGFFPNIQGA